jgi:carboxyl-terminal processing protease
MRKSLVRFFGRRSRLLVGTAFAAGVLAGPVGLHLARDAGLILAPHPALAAESSDATQQGSDTYRLLNLFGNVFERVRADYVQPVKDQELIDNALNGMLSGLDPHSSYMDASQYRDMQAEMADHFGGIGLEVTQDQGMVKVISPIDGTPAARAGLRPGDLILSLDGKTLEGLSLTDAVHRLRGPAGSQLKLTVARQGEKAPIIVSLTREVIHPQIVHSRTFGDIGYVRLSEFDENAGDLVSQAINSLQQQSGGHLRGIVLDLRDNPGGLLDQAVAVADDFLSNGEIVSTHGRHEQDDNVWYARSGDDIAANLPVVVLVNNGTASAAEIVSGALQDNGRAAILGTRSFGKGSVQTIIPLPGEGAMRLTTARYYTPSGRSIQGLGITPDVTVQASRTETPTFGPERETDLNNTIANEGGVKAQPMRKLALPAMASQIAARPPANWPTFDMSKPNTDFQLQQALDLVHAMAGEGATTTAKAN